MGLVKKMLLIFGDDTKSITHSVITSLRQNSADEIVVVGSAVNDKIKKFQEQRGGINKTFDDYMTKELWDEIERKIFSWMKDWPDIKIKDDKSFKEMFIYDGISLWWLAERVVMDKGILEIIKFVEINKAIINIERPDKIVVVTDGCFDFESKVIGEIANRYKIPIERIQIKESAGSIIYSLLKKPCKPLKTIVKIGAFGINIIFHKYLYTINRFIYNSTKDRLNRPTMLMVTRYGNSARLYTNAEGKRRIGDLYWGDLDEFLANDPTKKVVNISFSTPKLWRRLSIFMEAKELLSKRLPYVPFVYYWNKNIILKVISTRKNLGGEWTELKKNPKFKKSLKYDGIDISDIMKNVFSTILLSNFPSAILSIETMKYAIEKEKADIVLLDDGVSPVIYATQAKNISSIGLQHGAFAKSVACLEHWHRKNEVSCDILLDSNKLACPTQTKTAVWSEHYKNFFVEGGYPEDIIVVTGCPRFDQLINADDLFSKQEFCKRYDLDTNKKIILITTQPLLKKDMFLKPILKALKEFHRIQMIIKPHQREDIKGYKKMIKEEKVAAIVIPSNSNTNEAIYSCDLLITHSSTTALEAMILHKPVITVNLRGKPDYTKYAESGAAIGVYKEEDLASAIKNALYNEEVRKKLAAARKKFVYDYAYIQDGKASERVADLIMQMIEESKRSIK